MSLVWCGFEPEYSSLIYCLEITLYYVETMGSLSSNRFMLVQTRGSLFRKWIHTIAHFLVNNLF